MAALLYLGTGERRYGLRPVHVYARRAWELEAVIVGRCSPTFTGQPHQQLRERTLWIFPPTTPHGWAGRQDEPCSVMVLHVESVPEPLRSAAIAKGFLACPLDPSDCTRLRELSTRLGSELASPTDQSALWIDLTLAEIALIACRHLPPRRLPADARAAARIAGFALTWLDEHLANRPGLEGAASAVGVSIAHLRRCFHRGLGKSPRAAMAELRLRRARDLLADPSARLDQVAILCGLSSASALSRLISRHAGHPPSRLRRPGLNPG